MFETRPTHCASRTANCYIHGGRLDGYCYGQKTARPVSRPTAYSQYLSPLTVVACERVTSTPMKIDLRPI